MTKLTFNCEWCGQPKEQQACHYKQSRHHFCSRDCLHKWLSQEHKGDNNPFAGRHHTDEIKHRIGVAVRLRQCGQANSFYGKHHTNEAKMRIGRDSANRIFSKGHRKKISIALARSIANGRGGFPRNARAGYYNGIYMRSQWEINTARWLDARGIRWEHDIIIPLGISSYVADFYLPEYGVLWEVKGYYTDYSRAKIARFRQLYPESKLALITGNVLRFMGVLK